jgi:hypothetical protein
MNKYSYLLFSFHAAFGSFGIIHGCMSQKLKPLEVINSPFE